MLRMHAQGRIKIVRPHHLLALIVMVAASFACGSIQDATSTATPQIDQPIPLATPYSQEPAAGICGSFDGNLVAVTIYVDIPDPRCVQVTPQQRLSVTNRTGGTVTVAIGGFEVTLDEGVQHTFDLPFGEYLAPGVHLVQVRPCCGPEIWLRSASE